MVNRLRAHRRRLQPIVINVDCDLAERALTQHGYVVVRPVGEVDPQ